MLLLDNIYFNFCVYVNLLVDYVYLDDDKKPRFAQVGHEHLIEQLAL